MYLKITKWFFRFNATHYFSTAQGHIYIAPGVSKLRPANGFQPARGPHRMRIDKKMYYQFNVLCCKVNIFIYPLYFHKIKNYNVLTDFWPAKSIFWFLFCGIKKFGDPRSCIQYTSFRCNWFQKFFFGNVTTGLRTPSLVSSRMCRIPRLCG